MDLTHDFSEFRSTKLSFLSYLLTNQPTNSYKNKNVKKKNMEAPGIEPGSMTCKVIVLPI